MTLTVEVTATNIAGSGSAMSAPVSITNPVLVPASWTAAATGTANNLIGSTFGAGVFVASGASNTLRNTSDGISWAASSGPATGLNQRGVFFNNKFLLGTNGFYALTSSDGLSFSLSSVSTSAAFVHASATRAVGVEPGGGGGLWYTSDAATFSGNAGPGYTLNSVLVDDPYVFVGGSVGFGGLWRTTDFTSWSTVAHGFSSGTIVGIAKGSGVHVILNSAGLVRRSTDGGVSYVAVAGVTLSNTPNTLKFLNGIFIATAQSGRIHYSADAGLTWQTVDTGLGATANDVSFGNGRFLVVGNAGTAAWSIPS